MKYMDRYNAARLAFIELVKQIRFMPNTRSISAEIVLEIAKVEQEGQLDYESIVKNPHGAIEGESKPQAIETGKE